MKAIGKETIHPALFYSGKSAGYITWIINLLVLLAVINIGRPPSVLAAASYVLTALSLFIITLSMINLGNSTRLGLPPEKTEFKRNGLYRFSRNPMYVGFNLLTLSSIIISWNIFIAVLGLYSIAVYHLIILGEENFLEKRFGKEYLEYKKRVRRYI